MAEYWKVGDVSRKWALWQSRSPAAAAAAAAGAVVGKETAGKTGAVVAAPAGAAEAGTAPVDKVDPVIIKEGISQINIIKLNIKVFINSFTKGDSRTYQAIC